MRSPLYEKAKMVVATYDSELRGDHWADAMDRAIRALRDEMREIDRALAALDEMRPR